MAQDLTFQQQQAEAYAFLDAFYNRSDFGYDVTRWKYSDVTQTIIDIVNQMCDDIFLNSKVLAMASVLFKEAVKNVVSGFARNFLEAMAISKIADTSTDMDIVVKTTRENIAKERDIYRSNALAWAVVTQVMAREKGNIELAFLGFM